MCVWYNVILDGYRPVNFLAKNERILITWTIIFEQINATFFRNRIHDHSTVYIFSFRGTQYPPRLIFYLTDSKNCEKCNKWTLAPDRQLISIPKWSEISQRKVLTHKFPRHMKRALRRIPNVFPSLSPLAPTKLRDDVDRVYHHFAMNSQRICHFDSSVPKSQQWLNHIKQSYEFLAETIKSCLLLSTLANKCHFSRTLCKKSFNVLQHVGFGA